MYTPPTEVGGNTLRPTRQTPIPGSRYGFHLPSPAIDSAASRGNSTLQSSSVSTVSSSLQGSVPPPSRDCSTAPVSRGGSAAPVSRRGSTVSRGGSVTPVSRDRAPTTSVNMPSVPLRASQLVQRAYNYQPRQLSRTLSVHDLNIGSRQQDYSVPAPPPYDYHDEDGGIEYSGNRDDSPPQHAGNAGFDEIDIDEISPDEDERRAEAALHTPGMHNSFVKFSTNDASGARFFIPRCRLLPRRARYVVFFIKFPTNAAFRAIQSITR